MQQRPVTTLSSDADRCYRQDWTVSFQRYAQASLKYGFGRSVRMWEDGNVFQQMAQNITVPARSVPPHGRNVSTFEYYELIWRLVKRTYPAPVQL